MINRQKSLVVFVVVMLLAVLSALFVYPTIWGDKLRPWRLGLDLVGGSHLVYEIDMSGVEESDRDSVAGGLRDVIEKRVNLFGVSEPQVVISQKSDSYRLNVDLAGIKDVKEAIKQIGETPLLVFKEVDFKEGDKEPIFNDTKLTGRYVSGAQVTMDNVVGRPQVSLTFNSEGALLFEELTGKNVGKPIAVFLDGDLIEMPVVQERIAGGRAQITGQFNFDTARKLVERFNAGALPAPINLIGQNTVGASLGADSLKRALIAGLVGTLVVMLFMLVYYRVLGFYAALALAVYVVLTTAVFKLFGVTMTLAGIAGFILSIGMAVDANILIFERAKEERKKGAGKFMALSEGFSRAWPPIRDSNISTMLTAIILYYATTGFVQGFALTLLIGVVMSMFSAITVTRAIIGVFARRESPVALPTTH
jgi:protein-export membrane protein SecD